jgi:hypothetical protein
MNAALTVGCRDDHAVGPPLAAKQGVSLLTLSMSMIEGFPVIVWGVGDPDRGGQEADAPERDRGTWCLA